MERGGMDGSKVNTKMFSVRTWLVYSAVPMIRSDVLNEGQTRKGIGSKKINRESWCIWRSRYSEERRTLYTGLSLQWVCCRVRFEKSIFLARKGWRNNVQSTFFKMRRLSSLARLIAPHYHIFVSNRVDLLAGVPWCSLVLSFLVISALIISNMYIRKPMA